MAIVVVAVAIGIAAELTLLQWLLSVVLPVAPLAVEWFQAARDHRGSAADKTSLEAKIMSLWRRGLERPDGVTVDDCRRPRTASWACGAPTQ